MTGEAFAESMPGPGGWAQKGGRGCHSHAEHHKRAAAWLMSRGRGWGGRPTPEDFERLEDKLNLRWMRGGPWGGPGGPWGPGGPGGPWGPFGHGGPRGRGRSRARRGDVRLALLRLLAEEPRNGYQLMQTIEERSDGRWSPSPGSVYPTLAQLEDEGLIRAADQEGGSRVFEITDAGRTHLETRAKESDPWAPSEPEGEGEGALVELGPLVIGIGKAAWQVASVGDQAQRAKAIEILSETRRALYRILAEDGGETPESEESDV